eukprot:365766-Chlamydomonas_euryale.AAC.3
MHVSRSEGGGSRWVSTGRSGGVAKVGDSGRGGAEDQVGWQRLGIVVEAGQRIRNHAMATPALNSLGGIIE